MRLRTLDLFCGGGGSSWGAQSAGAEIVCGVDAWGIATLTYADNFPHAKTLNLTLDAETGVEVLGDLGEIDLILASPECTNHTCAKGARPRDESSKLTARYLLNFASSLKPRWMVLENVVQMRNWHGYSPLIDAIKSLGYKILPQVIDAADFGVPQSRKRLFLLCDRKKQPKEVEKPQVSPQSARSVLDSEGTWMSRPLNNGIRASNTLARANRAIQNLGEGKPFLIVYYGSDGGGGWQELDRPLRTMTTLDRFGLVTWEGDTPMLRMLQVSELKRAMGFDYDYKLIRGSRRDRIKLLGNGVCPPVMKSILLSLSCELQESRKLSKRYQDKDRPFSNVINRAARQEQPYLASQIIDIVKAQAKRRAMAEGEIISMIRSISENIRLLF